MVQWIIYSLYFTIYFQCLVSQIGPPNRNLHKPPPPPPPPPGEQNIPTVVYDQTQPSPQTIQQIPPTIPPPPQSPQHFQQTQPQLQPQGNLFTQPNLQILNQEPKHAFNTQRPPNFKPHVPEFTLPVSGPFLPNVVIPSKQINQQRSINSRFNTRNPPNPSGQSKSIPGTLIAYIDGLGLIGYVMFIPNSSGTYTIQYHINGGLGTYERYDWRIYTNPAKRRANLCSYNDIGNLYYDLTSQHGQLMIGREVTVNSKINVTGIEDLLGRSLALVGYRVRVCGTLLPTQNKFVYEGRFHTPVAGEVYLFQSTNSLGILVEYLMYSDGQRKSTLHKWSLYEAPAEAATMEARTTNEIQKCENLVNKATPITLFDKSIPKLINIDNEDTFIKSRSYQTLRNIAQLNTKSIVYMVIYDDKDSTKILACTSFQSLKPKIAASTFNSQEIQGNVELKQDTPYEPTRINVDLTFNTSANPYSFGIDVLPKINRRPQETRRCPNIKENIFNPYDLDPEEVPAPGIGTSDQYAVGDLSGKYGPLDNPKAVKFETWERNLPLFGINSVVGRALVIYERNGSAFACANIELTNIKMSIAYATFDLPLQGQIIISQPENECYSDAYIYAELSKPQSDTAVKTYNHMWHIHTNSVEPGSGFSTTSCSVAGSHYNPFNVSISGIYIRDCNQRSTLRCEYGDMASKMSTVDIKVFRLAENREPDVEKYYHIDPDICISGHLSIVNRSIVIHESLYQTARLACANILEYKPVPT